MEHYKFTSWNFEKLESLAKCAEQLPEFPRFANLLNYFLLDRHEKSLTSNTSDIIGQHSFRNQHTNVTGLLKLYHPLQNRDVDRVLKFLQGKATLIFNGHVCNSHEKLSQHSSRIEKWVQDDFGDMDVSGTKLKYCTRYQAGNYQLGYDTYGLLVPREYENEAHRRKRQPKRQREEHSEVVEEEITNVRGDRTPVPKKTKAHLDSMYPSPPVSSPQWSILSSPPSSMDSDLSSELDEESIVGSLEMDSEESGGSRSAEEKSSNGEGSISPMSSRGESRLSARFGTPLPTCSHPQCTEQDSPTRAPSPPCGRPQSANSTQSRPIVLSPSAQFEGLPQSASFDQDATGTSYFDAQYFPEFKDPSPKSVEFPAP